MVRRRLLALAAVAALCSACVSAPERGCAEGAQSRVREMLYFGTATPDGVVSATEWDAFLRDTVTPRFPDGLTVFGAAGQWRGADGVIVREASYVLEVEHAGGASVERDVTAVIADYKSRFRQEAVMRASSPVCVSFE